MKLRQRVSPLQCLALISVSAVTLFLPQPVSANKTQGMIQLLSEHLDAARRNDGGYLAATATKEAAWQEYQRTLSVLGVSVTASATSFYSDRVEESRTGNTSSDISRSFTGHQAAITLRKPLFRKREQRAVGQAVARFHAASALLEAADHALFGQLFLAWIEILAARDLLQIAWEAVARGVAIRTEVQTQVQAGEATMDQLGLEIAREQLRWAELAEAQARLSLAEEKLFDYAGPGASVPLELTLESAVPTPIPDIDRAGLVALLEGRNPELRSARWNEEAARLELEKRSADHTPVVDLYASLSKGENDTASYIKDEKRIGLQVSVPLYTSGGISASVAQAEAELRRAQALSMSTAGRLRTQAYTAYAQLQSSLAKLSAAKSQIQAAELYAEATHRGLLAGTITTGELARAEAELLNARQRRLTEMLAFSQAWALMTITTAQVSPAFTGQTPLAPSHGTEP
jgi:outer membrane protein, protease secretion system